MYMYIYIYICMYIYIYIYKWLRLKSFWLKPIALDMQASPSLNTWK